jgi:hypothetical protein
MEVKPKVSVPMSALAISEACRSTSNLVGDDTINVTHRTYTIMATAAAAGLNAAKFPADLHLDVIRGLELFAHRGKQMFFVEVPADAGHPGTHVCLICLTDRTLYEYRYVTCSDKKNEINSYRMHSFHRHPWSLTTSEVADIHATKAKSAKRPAHGSANLMTAYMAPAPRHPTTNIASAQCIGATESGTALTLGSTDSSGVDSASAACASPFESGLERSLRADCGRKLPNYTTMVGPLALMVASTASPFNIVDNPEFRECILTASTIRSLTRADLPGRKGVQQELLRQEATLRLEQTTFVNVS